MLSEKHLVIEEELAEMTRNKMMILATAVCLVLISLVTESNAQGRYRPRTQNRSVSRPTLSPYMDLIRSGRYAYGPYGMVDPRLAPYIRQNQSTASRLPRRETTN